jgi:hypothetical protein
MCPLKDLHLQVMGIEGLKTQFEEEEVSRWAHI